MHIPFSVWGTVPPDSPAVCIPLSPLKNKILYDTLVMIALSGFHCEYHFFNFHLQYGLGHVPKGQGTGNFGITMEDMTDYGHVHYTYHMHVRVLRIAVMFIVHHRRLHHHYQSKYHSLLEYHYQLKNQRRLEHHYQSLAGTPQLTGRSRDS